MNNKPTRSPDEMQKIARGCISELTKTEWANPNLRGKALHDSLTSRLIQIEQFENLTEVEKAHLYRYLVVNLLVNINGMKKR
jgi:hypothetical protein